MEKRYAYRAWICATCDGHCIETNKGLKCERCGFEYRITGMYGNAEFVPDADYDEEYIAALEAGEVTE